MKTNYPNFNFIPILKVFGVKTEPDDSGSNDQGSRSGGYKRPPGFEGVASWAAKTLEEDLRIESTCVFALK